MASTMDAKQLSDAGKQIVKAAEGGDPASTLLHLLQPLQKFTATEDLLRQSKIGIAVNKLRQSKDAKVAQVASQLINKWKVDVKGSGKGGKAAAGSSPAPGAQKAGTNGTSSPAGSKTDGSVKKEPIPAQRKSTVAPDKRTITTDEVDTKVTGDQSRDSCIGLMYNGLAYLSSASPDAILPVARAVEQAAYEVHGRDTSSDYKAKIRSLFQNLKMKGNTALRRDVLEGEIEPKRFVTMSSDDLKSAEKRAQDAALEKENMKQSMTAQEEKAISTTMTCGKCRQSRVAYTQAQTRAADEPMTTFCECVNCGNRWKFS
ncbi:transcription elongation factor TFIIS [Friedmanniomyces endolithicus]|uniref:Transcription elongation factor n=1 Tax=Friedmanniomyces endolithicus TaxID=329885 RepID=A0AAN6KVW9_9PEZI|nr:transcription elongation factor TFIIS [Friedmanniomyces endolithicus]KAK0797291.1 transcription elongation factor TFIIS [Friedmanniomyces endolithicus]KAK0805234.1 transcription elongation factor TFIIS [Friedmanniomyces endolithicus]KAK0815148.1 transcription elongation factor TFIIS [Friedmanniomyces endolithicus]KAK0852285.1 transcription elongation factor TFIIS [Friedmanniomyces endolithicus]